MLTASNFNLATSVCSGNTIIGNITFTNSIASTNGLQFFTISIGNGGFPIGQIVFEEPALRSFQGKVHGKLEVDE